MKIVIKTTNIKLTRELQRLIDQKINQLENFAKILQQKEKYFDSFFGKGKPRVEAWIEVGKKTLHHQKGPFFWAEAQLRFPKRSLRATATAKDLKLAICEVKDELQRQLKKYRQKVEAQTKRRARVLKKLLKISPQARLWRKGRIREEGI